MDWRLRWSQLIPVWPSSGAWLFSITSPITSPIGGSCEGKEQKIRQGTRWRTCKTQCLEVEVEGELECVVGFKEGPEIGWPMKYDLPSSTMSSTMGRHIERLENVSSQISAGAQWHPLSGFFEQPTGRLQYSLYCRAFPTEQCNMNYSTCKGTLLAPTVIYNFVPLRVQTTSFRGQGQASKWRTGVCHCQHGDC